MATGTHTVEVPVGIEYVWDFVSDMEKWAKLVPGYNAHEMIDEKHSTWTFKGNVGVLKKTVEVEITILEWIAPSKVTFELKGLSDNFTGNGYFLAESIDAENTKMTGFLEVIAGGLAGPVLNPIFKPIVPKATQMLTDRVANKIKLVNV
ncbi:SRPBCC family protein [Lysinibacillus capsici]|uniref:CoxG family protein n=1 Tax=Lysinibacillus capsici TaxID=2115968 RepID=UPI0028EC7979|nr:SRPBCC family protein [Lysinibacillus capsici]MED4551988.1 SRPBCC family protein [Lysinibacillus capsici]